MAKYDIIQSCGHMVTHNIVGPEKQRPYQVERLKNQPCWECIKRQRFDDALSQATSQNLAQLTGSEKQIQWATTIRAEALKEIDETFESSKASALKAGLTEQEWLEHAGISEALHVAEQLRSTTSSGWWISQRGVNGLHLLYSIIEGRIKL